MGRRSLLALLRRQRTGVRTHVGAERDADAPTERRTGEADGPPPSIGIGTDDDGGGGIKPPTPPKTPAK